MDEILKKLIESDLLSEETKAELSEQISEFDKSFREQIREEVTGQVRLELAEQWAGERDELVEKIDSLVTEALKNELSELQGDIDRFRDLEVEFAEKLQAERQALAEQVAQELDDLVEKMDAFFEMRLTAEAEELREDLQIAKENDFGRKIFEAFQQSFASAHVDEDGLQSQLVATEAKLKAATKALAEAEAQAAKQLREAKLEKLLAPLTGVKREQMELVLKSVETSRLDESYKFFLPRVLREDKAPVATLSETKIMPKTTVVTGEEIVTESAEANQTSDQLAEFKRLAGVR